MSRGAALAVPAWKEGSREEGAIRARERSQLVRHADSDTREAGGEPPVMGGRAGELP